MFSGLGITASAATDIWDGNIPAYNAASTFNGGSGTPASPYIISTATSFAQLMSNVNGNGGNTPLPYNGAYFNLTVDINLDNHNWTPIGGASAYIGEKPSGAYFGGVFNGYDANDATYNTHVISNLQIYASSVTAASNAGYGLFGHVEGVGDNTAGVLMNLTVQGMVTVNPGSSTSVYNVGGLVGYTSGIVWNCHNEAGVVVRDGGSSMVGGIAGAVEGDGIYVRYSSNTGSITGGSRVGGIAGALYCEKSHGAIIDNCFNKGNVATVNTDRRAYVGGIVGYSTGFISNSYNYDATLGTTGGHYLGGIAGMLQSYGPQAALSNSYTLGHFTSSADPTYDRLMMASVDQSPTMFISNSLWVDTTKWSGAKNPTDIIQPISLPTLPWGKWTNVGHFGSDTEEFDDKLEAVVYSGSAAWELVSALDTLNEDSPGVALGGQYEQNTTRNNGYPYLLWELTPGDIPETPAAPVVPPPPEYGIFLDGVNGSDGNPGTLKFPVQTFGAAKTLLMASDYDTIYILDTVTVEDTESWSLPSTLMYSVKRSVNASPAAVDDAMVVVELFGELSLNDIAIDGSSEYIYSQSSPIRVDREGKLNINNGTVIRNSAAVAGGAVTVTSNGELNINDGALIENNIAASGGAVNITESGTVNMSGGIIRNNSATVLQTGASEALGGAFYVAGPGTVLNVTGGQLLNNEARTDANGGPAYGGAIYAGGGATVNISNGIISDNSAYVLNTNSSAVTKGGGVYIAAGATVTVTGGTLSGNTATVTNNPITNPSGNGAVVDGGTLTITPSDSVGLDWSDEINLASASDYVTIGAELSNMNGVLNISTAVAPDVPSQSLAVGVGGYTLVSEDISKILYYYYWDDPTTDDPGFYAVLGGANNAVLSQGVVYLSYDATGGGTGTRANPYGLLDDTLADAENRKLIVLMEPTYQLTGSELNLIDEISLRGARIRRDAYFTGAMFNISVTGVVVSGVTIDGNKAIVPNSTGSIITVASGANVNVAEGAVLQNNAATAGGAINSNNGAVAINGAIITGNTVGTANGTRGGGIYMVSGALKFNSGRVSGNVANGGGGVYLQNVGTASEPAAFTGGTITQNSASGSGGGLYLYGSSYASISGTKIDNNALEVDSSYAGATGGGIYATNTASVLMTGGSVDGNTGGGVYSSSSGSFTMSGGSISNNNSPGSGGAYDATNGTFTMSGSAVMSNNIADGDGGGIYFNGSALNLNGGTISNNVTQGNAGGVFTSATTTIAGVQILNNQAIGYGNAYSGQGGGLYVSFGSVSFTSGSISGNIAGGSGGGVYRQRGSAFTLDGGTISDNVSAQNGGGIYIYGGTPTTFTSGSITGNKAQNGGGIYSEYNSTLDGVTISNNTAVVNGGGVYQEGYSFLVNSGSITDNTAGTDGNGIYLTASNSLTLTPSGSDAVTFGTGTTANDIYLPGGVYFRIGSDLGTGIDGAIRVTFGSPSEGDTVAQATSGTMASSSLATLVPTGGQELEVSGSNIVIFLTRQS
jgi:hypothetical protein